MAARTRTVAMGTTGQTEGTGVLPVLARVTSYPRGGLGDAGASPVTCSGGDRSTTMVKSASRAWEERGLGRKGGGAHPGAVGVVGKVVWASEATNFGEGLTTAAGELVRIAAAPRHGSSLLSEGDEYDGFELPGHRGLDSRRRWSRRSATTIGGRALAAAKLGGGGGEGECDRGENAG